MFGKKRPVLPSARIEMALRASQSEASIRLAETSGAGKRSAKRKKIWAPCELTWPPNGRAEGICIDLSDSGARIRFSHRIIVPDRLRIVSPRLGLKRDCEIVRQDGLDAVVRFIA